MHYPEVVELLSPYVPVLRELVKTNHICILSHKYPSKARSVKAEEEISLWYIEYFVMLSDNSAIMQFWDTKATNCRVLTRCMNLSYVVGHKRANSFLFQCDKSVL
jgi:hypothetical protein